MPEMPAMPHPLFWAALLAYVFNQALPSPLCCLGMANDGSRVVPFRMPPVDSQQGLLPVSTALGVPAPISVRSLPGLLTVLPQFPVSCD